MDIRLPITEWVSYTPSRLICAWQYPEAPGNEDAEVHFAIHAGLSAEDIWNNSGMRNAMIRETVKGYVENCRVAFNAGLVAEARDDETLVPRSSVLYLDAACIYTLGLRGKVYYVRPGAGDYPETKVYFSEEFYDDWQDAMVYFRSIRTLHQTTYTLEQEIINSMGGTPVYLGRIDMPEEL